MKASSSSSSFPHSLWNHGGGRLSLLLLLSTVFVFLSHSTNTVNAAAFGKERREAPNQRNIVLYNQSGRRVDAFWINRSHEPNTYHSNSDNGEGYPFGAQQAINSYIGHEFEIREMPSKKTGACQDPDNCRKGLFQVNDQEGQSKYCMYEFSNVVIIMMLMSSLRTLLNFLAVSLYELAPDLRTYRDYN
jgi:hypothetical protein